MRILDIIDLCLSPTIQKVLEKYPFIEEALNNRTIKMIGTSGKVHYSRNLIPIVLFFENGRVGIDYFSQYLPWTQRPEYDFMYCGTKDETKHVIENWDLTQFLGNYENT